MIPQPPWFWWGPTWAHQARHLGSLPQSRKALYYWTKLHKSARTESQPGFTGKTWWCSVKLQRREILDLLLLWLVSAVMKNAPPAARTGVRISWALISALDYPKDCCKLLKFLCCSLSTSIQQRQNIREFAAQQTDKERTFSSSPASGKVQSRVQHYWQLPVPSTHENLFIIESTYTSIYYRF